jgi:hypothetical protein
MNYPDFVELHQSSRRRSAETKRHRTINEFLGAAAIEFHKNGYRDASTQAIIARSSRSAAAFYAVMERKSRAGIMVVDATFSGMAEVAKPADGGPITIGAALQRFADAIGYFAGIEHAFGEELAVSSIPLRESLPSVAVSFEDAITAEVDEGRMPETTDVYATTNHMIALVGGLLSIPGFEASRRQLLIHTYINSLASKGVTTPSS